MPNAIRVFEEGRPAIFRAKRAIYSGYRLRPKKCAKRASTTRAVATARSHASIARRIIIPRPDDAGRQGRPFGVGEPITHRSERCSAALQARRPSRRTRLAPRIKSREPREGVSPRASRTSTASRPPDAKALADYITLPASGQRQGAATIFDPAVSGAAKR
jgi:hypothetical protein